jgi:hypothetical protein
MRKNIDIKDDLIADIAYLAAKEKRRNKTDSKNFIEDIIENYVIKNAHPARKNANKKARNP